MGANGGQQGPMGANKGQWGLMGANGGQRGQRVPMEANRQGPLGGQGTGANR